MSVTRIWGAELTIVLIWILSNPLCLKKFITESGLHKDLKWFTFVEVEMASPLESPSEFTKKSTMEEFRGVADDEYWRTDAKPWREKRLSALLL
ncbi:hypothetical protein Nepgr_003223 [Nepenthes gracilis]|uniref:Uncharacterized protein n=1 Tax=Nepenthes gracilis TaxID=150966 RepID=A0AAD3RZ81_NEPGR|nr:hypothetical protein Nepgr_003223 [Nepenthes gracilis]